MLADNGITIWLPASTLNVPDLHNFQEGKPYKMKEIQSGKYSLDKDAASTKGKQGVIPARRLNQ
jgi:hypothetical protein